MELCAKPTTEWFSSHGRSLRMAEVMVAFYEKLGYQIEDRVSQGQTNVQSMNRRSYHVSARLWLQTGGS